MQSPQSPFGNNEKLKFPLSYDLKIIVISGNNHDDNKAMCEQIFVKLNVRFSNWRQKESKKGKYTSYTVHVRIIDEMMMKQLYAELNSIPGIKMAI